MAKITEAKCMCVLWTNNFIPKYIPNRNAYVYVHQKTCTVISVSLVFKIASKWEQSKCPSTRDKESYTDSPQLGMVWLMICLTFWWYKRNTHSVETTLWIPNFDLFLGYWYAVWSSRMMLAGGNEPQFPVSHARDHEW